VGGVIAACLIGLSLAGSITTDLLSTLRRSCARGNAEPCNEVGRRYGVAALAGRPLTPRVRAKLARAVEALIGQAAELRQPFADVAPRHRGAPPAPRSVTTERQA
jgi:hypothetical protein